MSATPRERVHAMEALAATIAHELRAGVLAITSAAQLLRYAIPPDPVAEKSLGRILQESERLSALHATLTEYATELPPRTTADHPDRAWTAALQAIRSASDAKGVNVTHSSASATTAQIDREQLAAAFERVLHHALSRVQSGADLDVVSSEEDGAWTSTVSARNAVSVAKMEFDRASLPLMLAQRTILAHGGELTEHPASDAPLLVGVRLPLSLHRE